MSPRDETPSPGDTSAQDLLWTPAFRTDVETVPVGKPDWTASTATIEPEKKPDWLSPQPPEVPAAEPPRSLGPRARFARGAVALVLVAGLAGYAGGKLGNNAAPTATGTRTSATATTPSNPTAAPTAETLAALYQQVSPSVVQILVNGRGTEGSGSGVIVDAAGTILTNNHVVDGATSVRVVLADGRTLQGTIAGRDAQGDLAVVKLTNPPSGLVAATLGNSDNVVVGQTVFAIGAPFGLQGTLTSGIVSAVNRTFQGNDQYPAMRGLIQTDAAINPGNSGGPLFNLAGEVVGITTAIESPVRGSVGIGFAVPIKQALAALPALVKGSSVQHPFLGIAGEPATGGGVTILAINPGSTAEAAGIQAGDVILAIAGTQVDSVDALAQALSTHKVGEVVKITFRRNGKTMTVNATLRAYQGG